MRRRVGVRGRTGKDPQDASRLDISLSHPTTQPAAGAELQTHTTLEPLERHALTS